MSEELFRSLVRRIETLEKQLNKTAVTESSGSGGSGAPVGAQYVTLAIDGTLTQERVLTGSANIAVTDSGAGAAVTLTVVQGSGSGLDADTVDGLHGANLVQTSRQVSTGPGLDGGGALSGDLNLNLKFSTLTDEPSADNADYVAIYDTSAGAMRKQSRNNFLSGVTAAAASETSAGVIELATQAETDTGTDDARALTPLKLFAHAWPTVSITGGTTLTSSAFSKIHICTGTTADYTVTLPAVSGNAGRWIAFVMSNALTKLVTLDGSDAETINGALTRVMWANEWALLYCDGAQWHKQAGLTIPMIGILQNGSAEAINASAIKRPVSVPTKVTDIGSITDGANSKINCRRGGQYLLYGASGLVSGTTIPRFFVGVYVNGTAAPAGMENGVYSTSTNPYFPALAPYALTAGDYVELGIFHTSSTSPLNTLVGSALKTTLALIEVVSW